MEYLMKTDSIGGLTEDQFFYFCQENDPMRLERNADGLILVMEPTYTDTDFFNTSLCVELGIWNREKKLGAIFGSNAGFTLPNNAVRSPDAAFIRKERWKSLTKDDREKFAHICPDFVMELQSKSDSIDTLKSKMIEYMENGCLLAWLIDPKKRMTFIYRKNTPIEIVNFDTPLSGEDVLPGFSIDLRKIFDEEI